MRIKCFYRSYLLSDVFLKAALSLALTLVRCVIKHRAMCAGICCMEVEMSGNDKQDLYSESKENTAITQGGTQSAGIGISEESPDNSKRKVNANTPVLLLLNPEPERTNIQNLPKKSPMASLSSAISHLHIKFSAKKFFQYLFRAFLYLLGATVVLNLLISAFSAVPAESIYSAFALSAIPPSSAKNSELPNDEVTKPDEDDNTNTNIKDSESDEYDVRDSDDFDSLAEWIKSGSGARDEALRAELYAYKPPEAKDGEYPIIPADLSVENEYGLAFSNETSLKIDLSDYLAAPAFAQSLDVIKPENESTDFAPIVLIVHTHGTESYAPAGVVTYSTSDNARSTDKTKNVVAVGAVMAEYFNSVGIPTVHCEEMLDEESYRDAYTKEAETIKAYIKKYPSIKYVFDVHRDSVIGSNYEKYRPVTVIGGKTVAQFMCVVGTNFKGADHDGWENCLSLAVKLQALLWERSSSLVRRISLRGASYNQQYAEYASLLFEIGSCGNTLDEAKRCARIVAEELSRLIKYGW